MSCRNPRERHRGCDVRVSKTPNVAALCKVSLADSGIADEEIDEEAASITLQKVNSCFTLCISRFPLQAYVLHRLGNVSEAAAEYARVEALK